MKMKTWNKNECKAALPIAEAELEAMGITADDIKAGEKRGDLKTFGPWGIPVSYRALCMSRAYTPVEKQRYSAETDSVTSYGIRTLTNVRQCGYELEGRVSIGGKKYTAFSSSQLFELPDGRLIDVAIIHARVR